MTGQGGGKYMKRYYPHLTENITLEVSDEIAVVLSTGGRQCDSYYPLEEAGFF